ncbi:MAG: hypothetical protein JSR33_02455 [Proteobacteria bacterium]|nr:hypothetical protein [Pseudomonadota bacterium]
MSKEAIGILTGGVGQAGMEAMQEFKNNPLATGFGIVGLAAAGASAGFTFVKLGKNNEIVTQANIAWAAATKKLPQADQKGVPQELFSSKEGQSGYHDEEFKELTRQSESKEGGDIGIIYRQELQNATNTIEGYKELRLGRSRFNPSRGSHGDAMSFVIAKVQYILSKMKGFDGGNLPQQISMLDSLLEFLQVFNNPKDSNGLPQKAARKPYLAKMVVHITKAKGHLEQMHQNRSATDHFNKMGNSSNDAADASLKLAIILTHPQAQIIKAVPRASLAEIAAGLVHAAVGSSESNVPLSDKNPFTARIKAIATAIEAKDFKSLVAASITPRHYELVNFSEGEKKQPGRCQLQVRATQSGLEYRAYGTKTVQQIEWSLLPETFPKNFTSAEQIYQYLPAIIAITFARGHTQKIYTKKERDQRRADFISSNTSTFVFTAISSIQTILSPEDFSAGTLKEAKLQSMDEEGVDGCLAQFDELLSYSALNAANKLLNFKFKELAKTVGEYSMFTAEASTPVFEKLKELIEDIEYCRQACAERFQHIRKLRSNAQLDSVNLGATANSFIENSTKSSNEVSTEHTEVEKIRKNPKALKQKADELQSEISSMLNLLDNAWKGEKRASVPRKPDLEIKKIHSEDKSNNLSTPSSSSTSATTSSSFADTAATQNSPRTSNDSFEPTQALDSGSTSSHQPSDSKKNDLSFVSYAGGHTTTTTRSSPRTSFSDSKKASNSDSTDNRSNVKTETAPETKQQEDTELDQWDHHFENLVNFIANCIKTLFIPQSGDSKLSSAIEDFRTNPSLKTLDDMEQNIPGNLVSIDSWVFYKGQCQALLDTMAKCKEIKGFLDTNGKQRKWPKEFGEKNLFNSNFMMAKEGWIREHERKMNGPTRLFIHENVLLHASSDLATCLDEALLHYINLGKNDEREKRKQEVERLAAQHPDVLQYDEKRIPALVCHIEGDYNSAKDKIFKFYTSLPNTGFTGKGHPSTLKYFGKFMLGWKPPENDLNAKKAHDEFEQEVGIPPKRPRTFLVIANNREKELAVAATLPIDSYTFQKTITVDKSGIKIETVNLKDKKNSESDQKSVPPKPDAEDITGLHKRVRKLTLQNHLELAVQIGEGKEASLEYFVVDRAPPIVGEQSDPAQCIMAPDLKAKSGKLVLVFRENDQAQSTIYPTTTTLTQKMLAGLASIEPEKRVQIALDSDAHDSFLTDEELLPILRNKLEHFTQLPIQIHTESNIPRSATSLSNGFIIAQENGPKLKDLDTILKKSGVDARVFATRKQVVEAFTKGQKDNAFSKVQAHFWGIGKKQLGSLLKLYFKLLNVADIEVFSDLKKLKLMVNSESKTSTVTDAIVRVKTQAEKLSEELWKKYEPRRSGLFYTTSTGSDRVKELKTIIKKAQSLEQIALTYACFLKFGTIKDETFGGRTSGFGESAARKLLLEQLGFNLDEEFYPKYMDLSHGVLDSEHGINIENLAIKILRQMYKQTLFPGLYQQTKEEEQKGGLNVLIQEIENAMINKETTKLMLEKLDTRAVNRRFAIVSCACKCYIEKHGIDQTIETLSKFTGEAKVTAKVDLGIDDEEEKTINIKELLQYEVVRTLYESACQDFTYRLDKAAQVHMKAKIAGLDSKATTAEHVVTASQFLIDFVNNKHDPGKQHLSAFDISGPGQAGCDALKSKLKSILKVTSMEAFEKKINGIMGPTANPVVASTSTR